ncbi:MAG: glutamine--fructose-6-phosphate aminotransferase, partial [Desulfobacula sp.]|nr:glutamine--fructose-6-phosphate aminotransferase [Desulfobacula sp.]
GLDSNKNVESIKEKYLGGNNTLDDLLKDTHILRQRKPFLDILSDQSQENRIKKTAKNLSDIVKTEKSNFKQKMANLSHKNVKIISGRIEKLEDSFWCLEKEVLSNIGKIKNLSILSSESKNNESIKIFKEINAVLNSLDRLEVRGRDSAGISLVFTFTKNEFENFRASLLEEGLADRLKQRTNNKVLKNNCITIHDSFPSEEELFENKYIKDKHLVTISMVYKTASEIGALGDNIKFIRTQVKNDRLLYLISCHNFIFHTISSHTRWASVGDITEANCHPIDNTPMEKEIEKCGIIHVSLNGDIDNYLELKTEYEARYDQIHSEITTDTKLIPLQIEHYFKQGNNIEESFRLA